VRCWSICAAGGRPTGGTEIDDRVIDAASIPTLATMKNAIAFTR
jgi:hypothetical protein